VIIAATDLPLATTAKGSQLPNLLEPERTSPMALGTPSHATTSPKLYTNADYVGPITDRRSAIGHCMLLAGNFVTSVV